MKKKWLLLILFLLSGSILGGFSLLNTMAEESSPPAKNRYYTSIEIHSGDSLWSIAREYSKGGDINLEDYLKELKHMNNLKDDTIHSGQYLTVMYFSEAQEP